MAERPAVDVVVPFAGDDPALRAALDRLGALQRREDDTLTLVDNRPQRRGPVVAPPGVRVAAAGGRRGSYHARNRGAAAGAAPWIVFLDADVEPRPDLLDRYLAPAPATAVGVLVGAVRDEEPGPAAGAAVRYAWLRDAMSQETTLAHGPWAFAQTANCAVRREAFAAAGGFADAVRSGGDADLCWRLRAAGWQLERRDEAWVVHRNRTSVPALLAQRARHGAGAAWLARRHPGALPRRRWPGLAWWTARRAAQGVASAVRGERDEAVLGLLDGPAVWAFELGRLLPNRHLR